MNYPVVIHKDEDSDYGASFPDLLGCISAGDTIEEALAMATEAAEVHIEFMLDKGQSPPVAGNIEDYINDPEYADGIFWSFVTIDFSKLADKSKRINITVPERLLKVIDEHVTAKNLSRSGFLVSSALYQINSVE